MEFVNRRAELAALERWWTRDERAAVVWGRRRVGKTALLQQFLDGRRAVFHIGAGRSELEELRLLSDGVAAGLPGGVRDLAARPYRDWDDALEDVAARATDDPALLVLDELPELVRTTPALPGILRAFLDRTAGRTKLRVLLCGSAVRHMEAMQTEREPLYGRFDLSLLVHPFGPHEAALLLEDLTPADRALVYGVVGGVPLYLTWWDPRESVEDNLLRLVCTPGARLLTEGDLVLRTDVEGGELAQQVLHAIANGRTQHGEIKRDIGAEPMRTLERLVELRLVERVRPVGESLRTKRRTYRIVDPFLRFHLGVVSRFRAEIERGLGPSILPVLRERLDGHLGSVYEAAFRDHLRTLAAGGALPVDDPVVAIGPWWDRSGQHELDALVLTGASSTPAMAGEVKWATSVDGRRIVQRLRRKVETGLHLDPDDLTYVVCARDEVRNVGDDVLALTAADLFAPAP